MILGDVEGAKVPFFMPPRENRQRNVFLGNAVRLQAGPDRIAVGKHRCGCKAAGDAQPLGGIESAQTPCVAPARIRFLTELEAATSVKIQNAARELPVTLK